MGKMVKRGAIQKKHERIADLDVFERISNVSGINESVLRVVATAGLIGVFMIAPGLPAAFAPFAKKYRKNFYTKRAVKDLSKKGFIKFNKSCGIEYAELTEKGRKYIDYESRKSEIDLTKSRKWDKKWRMVIFDIPEKRRGIRDQFRDILERAGFFRLQDSVWVYPHDCQRFIDVLRSELRGYGEIIILEVTKVDSDEKLRSHFDL